MNSARRAYADLHIHVGYTTSGWVKMASTRRMTLDGILTQCAERKGVEVAGIVDMHSRRVQEEVRRLLETEKMANTRAGLIWHQGVLVLPACEVEVACSEGPAHFICYFPYNERIVLFSRWLGRHMANPDLSSQRVRVTPDDLLRSVEDHGGTLVPAHAFTPFRSIYASSGGIGKTFTRSEAIHAVELGLSADAEMASRVPELEGRVMLTSSDAHSPEKIGREVNVMRLSAFSAEAVMDTICGRGPSCIEANIGLDPRLGKYYRTRCEVCQHKADTDPPVTHCPSCTSSRVVLGVLDRLYLIKGDKFHPTTPYIHQVPLQFIPGVGRAKIESLAGKASELYVLHEADEGELRRLLGVRAASYVMRARARQLDVDVGGGGIYGRLKSINPHK